MPAEEASVSGWVRQINRGDKGLPVQKLWERYFQRLVELARAKLGDLPCPLNDEEDVALSAFDSFCQGALRGQFPQLHDREDLWRLLVTITSRKAYQMKLSQRRQKRGGGAQQANRVPLNWAGVAGDLGIEQIISEEPTPAFAVQAADEFRHLLASLEDPRLRELACLKMQGFTTQEIATKFGCVPRTVHRRLAIIRQIWSEELKK